LQESLFECYLLDLDDIRIVICDISGQTLEHVDQFIHEGKITLSGNHDLQELQEVSIIFNNSQVFFIRIKMDIWKILNLNIF